MNSAPPKLTKTQRPFILTFVIAIVALGGAGLLFFFNPATHSFYPVCQFHRLTGLSCPGCGMTRALYSLLHGKFSIALHYNALIVIALFALLARSLWFGWKKWRGRTNHEIVPIKSLWFLLVAALMFTALRNLPSFAFLAP